MEDSTGESGIVRADASRVDPQLAALLAQVAENPEQSAELIKAAGETNPVVIRIQADERLRWRGMIVGLTLTAVFAIPAGIAISVGSSAVLASTFLATAALCAGATFSVITGAQVTPSDWRVMGRQAHTTEDIT